jgi:DNA mismatch repair protein MutS2
MLTASQALEWQRFLDLATAEARTAPGQNRIAALSSAENWPPTLAGAKRLQAECQEISALLDRDGLWGPLTELHDPSDTLDRLGKGSVLETHELNLIRRWLYAVDSWTQMPREDFKAETFHRALQSLWDPSQALRILDRLLTPEGELSERASPRLGALHSEIRGLRREISVVLDQLLKTFSQKGVLQENFTDVRDGRYVLPIKISSQNEVEGIIYEASASRQTVFVEPKEVGALNNRLRLRQNELLQEILIILTEASKQLRPWAGDIQGAVEVISYWDATQARARLGRRYGGKAIHVTEERTFVLHQTAHPLLYWALEAGDVVRNELEFGDPIRTILITGPNTGGKTVLLKTLGLAAFCSRTGFPFPGTDRPTVPFFTSVFADLGDPQSIEQHLSSFSGHVLRFKDILENVTDQSLVLIDELNTATDPEEGAALGRAFLETIMAKGAMIVTTTHDPRLKALAACDQRILNASMAFNDSTRTPTYRILIGVPGRSRALETAARLGISHDVLDLARTYLSDEHVEFERMLSKLENDSREAVLARKEAVQLKEEALRLKKEWTERTESSVNDMLDRTRARLRRIVESAQDEVRDSVRKLDELKNRRDIDQTRSKLNESFGLASKDLESALHEEAPELARTLNLKGAPSDGLLDPPAEKKALVVGQNVRIPRWKSTGKVLEIQGQKIKVAMGAIQMTLELSDIEAIELSPADLARQNQPRARAASNLPPAPPQELDLRGVRFEEAMSQLEAYLDQAFRSGAYVEVTIITGIGTGAIREGTRKFLSKLPYVKTFRDGGVGRGGTGATLVEFDR